MSLFPISLLELIEYYVYQHTHFIPIVCVCVCVCVCVFFPFILDIKFVGRTSRGHTGRRSHRIFNNTTNTSVIKHALVPNGWVGGWVVGWCGGGWLGGVVVGGWVVWWWVVVVVVVGGRRQRCIVPSGW